MTPSSLLIGLARPRFPREHLLPERHERLLSVDSGICPHLS